MASVAEYLDTTDVQAQLSDGMVGQPAILGNGGYSTVDQATYNNFVKNWAAFRSQGRTDAADNLLKQKYTNDAVTWYKNSVESLPDRRVDSQPLITLMTRTLTQMDEVYYTPSANYPFADGKYIPYKPGMKPLIKFIQTSVVHGIGELRRGNIEVMNIPETDILASPEIYKIESYWGGYRMSEVESAIQLYAIGQGDPIGSIDVENLKNKSLAEAVKRKQQELQIAGDIQVGIPGILSGKDRQLVYGRYAINEESTPAEILSVLNTLVRAPQQIAGGASPVIPDMLMVPLSIAQIMNGLLYTQGSGVVAAKTVMQQFLDSNPHIKGVEAVDALEARNIEYYTRNYPNVIRHPVIIAYKRDIEYMYYYEAQPWTMLPPKTTWGGETIRGGRMRSAGIINKFNQNLHLLILDKN